MSRRVIMFVRSLRMPRGVDAVTWGGLVVFCGLCASLIYNSPFVQALPLVVTFVFSGTVSYIINVWILQCLKIQPQHARIICAGAMLMIMVGGWHGFHPIHAPDSITGLSFLIGTFISLPLLAREMQKLRPETEKLPK